MGNKTIEISLDRYEDLIRKEFVYEVVKKVGIGSSVFVEDWGKALLGTCYDSYKPEPNCERDDF